uniref:Junctional cadherin complex regulator n=1 Tax=Cynoglossus semilaevis TaxID=244447 RepID=A0A3P8WVS0_CYNSE
MGEGDGQTCPDLETERKNGTKQWESVESDTESLAQEKAYQQKLQSCPGQHDHDEHTHAENECTGSLHQGNGEDDFEEENLVYDSLDESSDPRTQRYGLFTDDNSAQCDGSRNNLKKNDNSADSSQISFEEVSKENITEEVEIKGGYRYIVVTSPADVETPQVGVDNANQPYHLHPGEYQASCVSPHNDSYALQDNSEGNISKSSVTSEEAHAADNQKDPSYPGGRATRHIVDRNKKTLGRTLPKRGSYVRKHVLKKIPDDTTEVSSEYPQRSIPGKLSHISPEGMNMQLYQQNKESHHEQTLRLPLIFASLTEMTE